jgi:hypothetical protein
VTGGNAGLFLFSVDLSRDNYSDSALGLTKSRDTGFKADATLLLTEKTSLHAFGGREQIKSQQAGSQAFAAADWLARNDDSIDSFGIGVKRHLIQDKLAIGLDYLLSLSTGEISIDSGTPNSTFPQLQIDLNTLKLYANYRLADNLSLHAAYRHENYHPTDWRRDGVNPKTVSNLIGLGETSPNYSLHLVMMSVHYRF